VLAAGWEIHGVRARMRAAFAHQACRERVQAGTVCSAIKRKLSAKAPARSLARQRKQALLLGLVYNLDHLWRQQDIQPQRRTVWQMIKFSTMPDGFLIGSAVEA
jgi:hypothetical protein